MTSQRYNFKLIEDKWQKNWAENKDFECDFSQDKPKYYVLEMFPYPSGRLHVGHVRNYTIGDVIARYKRAKGFNVLHPMGWDAFGLPAENAAIEKKIHPLKWTKENIAVMKKQIQSIGLSYNWSHEITTCDPSYYQHQQRIFLEFYKNHFITRKKSWVNWDPVEKTVLANEQVINGKGWRSGALVERKELHQWFLKVKDAAEELLCGLDELDQWPERVRIMQKNWIGKSTGATIDFSICGSSQTISIFTTRPDTLYGASFIGLSIDHPLIKKMNIHGEAFTLFQEKCRHLSTKEKDLEMMEKIGFDTGLKVQHPLLPERQMPLYILNYVLMDYASGAVFGCPAHDQRDHEIALKYNLPIYQVIQPEEGKIDCQKTPYEGEGRLIHSAFLNGLTIHQAKEKMTAYVQEKKIGTETITYRLRDWGISRQRYWGCPIPIIHCATCGIVPVKETDLPIILPEDVDFSHPGNPLDYHPDWKHVSCPTCGKPAQRETDTLDTFFDSSWYYLRFISPESDTIFDTNKVNHWMAVDQYIGGIEHAILHLLYSRFFNRTLYKCGFVNKKEPFKTLMTQGMVCHQTYKSKEGKWLFPYQVTEKKDGQTYVIDTDDIVTVGRSEKMSKSKKNVIDTDEMIQTYGADTVRFFMLSDSPPERDLEWSTSGIEGAFRFIHKLWNECIDYSSQGFLIHSLKDVKITNPVYKEIRQKTHETILAVCKDIQAYKHNRAIAHIRTLCNIIFALEKTKIQECQAVLTEAIETILCLLYPIIPHITEELWEKLGFDGALTHKAWPIADKNLIKKSFITLAVQINGKLRDTIEVPADLLPEKIEEKVKALSSIEKFIQGKPIKKIIIIPQRVVNIVV